MNDDYKIYVGLQCKQAVYWNASSTEPRVVMHDGRRKLTTCLRLGMPSLWAS